MPTYVLTAGRYADSEIVAVVRADDQAGADRYAEQLTAQCYHSTAPAFASDMIVVGASQVDDLVDLTAAAARVRVYGDAMVQSCFKLAGSYKGHGLTLADFAVLVGPAPEPPAPPVNVGDVLDGRAAQCLPVDAAACAEWTHHERDYQLTGVRGPKGWVSWRDPDHPFEWSDDARVTVLHLPDVAP